MDLSYLLKICTLFPAFQESCPFVIRQDNFCSIKLNLYLLGHVAQTWNKFDQSLIRCCGYLKTDQNNLWRC